MKCDYCKADAVCGIKCIGCTSEKYCSLYCQQCSWLSGHYIKCKQNLHPDNIIIGSLRSDIQSIDINSFERVAIDGNEVLGTGAFGKVVRVKKISTGALYALKIIQKSHAIKHRILSGIQAEIEIQSKLRHQNIIDFEGWAEDINNIYCVMEIAGESINKSFINKIKTEEQIKDVFLQICYGIYFLHLNGYVHRDIKSENILLKNDKPKIIDFGLSSKIGCNSRRVCGTIEYMAPELFDHMDAVNFQIDIYSLGILLYELFHKHTPYIGKQYIDTIKSITKTAPSYSPLISEAIKDLISKLIHKIPAKRLTWNQIFTHVWFTGINQNSCKKIGEAPCMLNKKVIFDDKIDEESNNIFISDYYRKHKPVNATTLKKPHRAPLNASFFSPTEKKRISFHHGIFI